MHLLQNERGGGQHEYHWNCYCKHIVIIYSNTTLSTDCPRLKQCDLCANTVCCILPACGFIQVSLSLAQINLESGSLSCRFIQNTSSISELCLIQSLQARHLKSKAHKYITLLWYWKILLLFVLFLLSFLEERGVCSHLPSAAQQNEYLLWSHKGGHKAQWLLITQMSCNVSKPIIHHTCAHSKPWRSYSISEALQRISLLSSEWNFTKELLCLLGDWVPILIFVLSFQVLGQN